MPIYQKLSKIFVLVDIQEASTAEDLRAAIDADLPGYGSVVLGDVDGKFVIRHGPVGASVVDAVVTGYGAYAVGLVYADGAWQCVDVAKVQIGEEASFALVQTGASS
ncbi:hypothetical protein ACWEOE_28865 [Amycolatopsis sp. NPDC004368]